LYEEKWISLKPCKKNKTFFSNVKAKNPELELVKVISNLSLKEDGPTIYRDAPFLSNIRSIPKFKNENSIYSLDSLSKEYVEIHFPYSILPIANQFGEDSTVFIDGEEMNVFPNSEKLSFLSTEISEIRIHEIRKYDSIKKSYDYKADGICFVHSSGKELFWLRLNDLYNYLKNSTKYPWYISLMKREYEGEIYMYRLFGSKEIKFVN
jgi:hypothetical protein